MRRLFVAGNWKMNATLASSVALAQAVAADVRATKPAVDVAVFPPFPYLLAVRDVVQGTGVWLGAQNMHAAAPGAFTGEVASTMLKDCGCEWVILGHSERRQFFGDTDAAINQKIQAALVAGLKIIFCVGELLAEREAGKTESVLDTQMSGGLQGIEAAALANLVIAYEPVWAIGTGKTATPADVKAMHGFIRKKLKEQVENGLNMRILYGGSMKPENAGELLATENVDGGLIGGASLKADQFLAIAQAA